MRVKEFLLQIPYLCDAKNADRWSRLIELQFDEELNNPGSVFARNKLDMIDPSNRLETAFGFIGNGFRKNHCAKLVELIILNHYKKEHNENQWNARINILIEELIKLENENIDIANTYSINDALVSRWDG